MGIRRIKIIQTGNVIEARDGDLIMDILDEAGIGPDYPCGGRGICGKCLITASGQLSEKTELEKNLPDDSSRLACRTRISGDCEISLPDAPGRNSESIPGIYGKELAAAVDIGTTSIKISIIDLESKAVHSLKSFLNPQRKFGWDVISRISAADNKQSLEKMSKIVRDSIEKKIISALASPMGNNLIKKVTISGNTTMEYLFLGLDVVPLGKFPYHTEHKDFDRFHEISRMKLLPEAELKIIPAASAYIGGDLTGGLGFIESSGYDDKTFFADLGTNGEMFIRKASDQIFATSCAMGPALEGMSISCGMTATDGAINHVKKTDGSITIEVIGDEVPAGICGTGIIDLVSIMIESGIINSSGKINSLSSTDGAIVKDNQIFINEKIFISQKDIRNIQLAKGASLAAGKILLQESCTDPDEISHVFIAGAFGEHLDIERFKSLKFIPEFKNAEYKFVGNTSLGAAEKICIDNNFYNRLSELRDMMKIVELSVHKNFNDTFLSSLDF